MSSDKHLPHRGVHISSSTKLGSPENSLDKRSIRLHAIEKAISEFRFVAQALINEFADRLGPNTSLFIKGFGNSLELFSPFRALFFNSRELLDIYLLEISNATSGTARQTPRSFLPFVKKLMNGSFDHAGMNTFDFLRTNITYIFSIRKARNEIKVKAENIEFRFNTDHFEAYFHVPIKKEEQGLVQYLDIQNKEEAVRNNSYHCTYVLDNLFPEMLDFWKTAFSILDADLRR
jgi:hypothetical protein